jgi:uncharacterized protein (DUF58 family)
LEIHLETTSGKVAPGLLEGGKGVGQPKVFFQFRPELRGQSAITCVELHTSYPFGFLEKIWRFHVNMPLSVSPHPSGHGEPEDGIGDFLEPTPKSGYSSPVGARPFMPGDSISRIHWKRTAQRGEPWVRVMEGDQPKGMTLELDLGKWQADDDFERELEYLSGAILQARLRKQEATLTIHGKHGRADVFGHIAAWKALAILEAEGSGYSPHQGGFAQK